MEAVPARISAADITVPPSTPKPPVATPVPHSEAKIDISLVLHRIGRMLDGCSTSNRNDLLVIAIRALIEAGVDTDRRIVGAVAALGFRREHAGAILSKSRGDDPARHKWQRSADGAYRVHAAALAA